MLDGSLAATSVEALGGGEVHNANPWQLGGWRVLVALLTLWIVAKGVQQDIENAVRWMMPGLLANLSVGKKLICGFGLALLLTAAMTGIGFLSVQAVLQCHKQVGASAEVNMEVLEARRLEPAVARAEQIDGTRHDRAWPRPLRSAPMRPCSPIANARN